MTVPLRFVAFCLVTLVFASSIPAQIASDAQSFSKLSADRDWPWWRGMSRNGMATKSATPPVSFSDTEAVLWKAPVPGRGHSSPIIIGNSVFLTTADEATQTQSALAFDLQSGKTLWSKPISQGAFPARIHNNNTNASPTIGSDGERLFITFYHHDSVQATALGLDGKPIWQRTVGGFRPRRYEYGYAPSPLLYRNTVIVTGEYDGDSFITALNRQTGAPVWRIPRENNITFSSPVVAHVAGRDQMLISGTNKVASFDPATGKPLWSVDGTSAATCGTMVWDGDIVFASGGYPKAETIAVRASGKGEVLWKNAQKCYEQSMLAYDGHLYALTDNGVAYCWRGKDGQELWRERLQGPVSASPILAGGHIYWANERGTLYVYRPSPQKFELVSTNRLGDESFASPAVSGGKLLLRVGVREGNRLQEYLYCFGK